MIFIFLAAVIVIAIWYYLKADKQVRITQEMAVILKLLNETTESVFITGKAGSGKSTLLRYFISKTKKKIVVLAPTGVAALNIGGQTIHSFFRFGFNVNPPIAIDYVRHKLFNKIDMIIVDEVSMVRVDLMNSIDKYLRLNRNASDKPFGGIQMVFIGDLFQLPPVLLNNDRNDIINQYGSQYFFDAPVFKSGFLLHKKELTKVFRQKDEAFISALNRIRINNISHDDFILLNSRHVDNVGDCDTETVYLTTTNKIVRQVNDERLNALEGAEFCYNAILTGSILDKYEQLQKRNDLTEENYDKRLDNEFPAPVRLRLKIQAQIMMIRNDPVHRWVNGSVGKIVKLTESNIWVKIHNKVIKVEKEVWEEKDYRTNNDDIKQEGKGKFIQYPMRLAWAMTIHKSQGKTMDSVLLDIGNGTFAHGQAYVALSRVKRLDGLFLKRQIVPHHVIVDDKVLAFSNG